MWVKESRKLGAELHNSLSQTQSSHLIPLRVILSHLSFLIAAHPRTAISLPVDFSKY
jgi:hypothetical protein